MKKQLERADALRLLIPSNDTLVWGKLYRFQHDGVLGAIDKMEKYNGCIIADSVGLGKTFEALAIIKYYDMAGFVESDRKPGRFPGKPGHIDMATYAFLCVLQSCHGPGDRSGVRRAPWPLFIGNSKWSLG